MVFIPAGYTDYLQPMDLSVNKSFKDVIRQQFDECLITIMADNYKRGEALSIDFTLPQLKSKIVEWCGVAYGKIDSKIVKTGSFFSDNINIV